VGQPWAATSTVRISRRAATGGVGVVGVVFAGPTDFAAFALFCKPEFKAVAMEVRGGAIVGAMPAPLWPRPAGDNRTADPSCTPHESALRSTFTFALVATTAAMSACTAPPTAPAVRTPPAYLNAASGCAVVAGGGIGSQFSDQNVTATWDKVNAAVTTELHDRLVAQRYQVVKLLVPTERTAKAEDIVLAGLAAHRCNRLLQVSHKVDEDSSGRYFRFDIALLRMAPKEDAGASPGSVSVRAIGEYRREYRYPRTQESFENFYTGTFAEQVLADLNRSGTLGPLRP
jgi:hypothetical protein